MFYFLARSEFWIYLHFFEQLVVKVERFCYAHTIWAVWRLRHTCLCVCLLPLMSYVLIILFFVCYYCYYCMSSASSKKISLSICTCCKSSSRENSDNLVAVRHWFYNSRGSLGCLPVVLSCPVQTKTITINNNQWLATRQKMM